MKTQTYHKSQNRNSRLRGLGLSLILMLTGIFGPLTGTSMAQDTPVLTIYPAVELQFDSETGAAYEVQAAATVDSPQWQPFGSVLPGTGGTLSVFAATRNKSQQIFRVVEVEGGSGQPQGIDTFGTIIDQPGHYVLTADLAAGAAAGPAITITADDVTLDLKGHTITGNADTGNHDNLGIWLRGTEAAPRRNVHVTNGALSGFHFALWLDYSINGGVSNMNLSGNRGGIGLNGSTDNVIKQNNSSNNSVSNGVGILLQRHSDRNDLVENVCNNNFFQGIFLNGSAGGNSENNLLSNTCNENGLVGIWLTMGSNRNNLVNNITMKNNALGASPNGGIGLGFPGSSENITSGNVIVSNTLMDNTRDDPQSWDAFDNSLCENLWQGNEFVVDNELGGDAGPDVGCIQ